ncbi:Putative peptidoglycan binding domain-containing protein [Streptomyces sp. cf386]|uniref:peptidoglycan-binding domain-containing protein n=1 Tax=Streptomyces sp. cf386 TaxID=1761904 RepID=UPI0008863418|nr:peptidoglycan-binding domain-containing protein [Streptomyces sp. cf386]SDO22329.1 Putative peptidoglycan binding domain-containing protein [Streptomyces sp. cf386]
MSEPRGTAGAKGPDDPGHPKGRRCPECGVPRAADNTPSCGCGPRASEALRDARTAEAAAAEDFDPLRIRPYVELEGGADETMPLRPVPPAVEPTSAPSAQDLSLFEPDATRPAAPYADEADGEEDGDAVPRGVRRHRRTALLGVGGALVAVVTAAGLASGMLTYEKPTRDTALPDEVRASIPAPSTSEASQEPSPAGPSTQAAPPSVSASPTESAPPSPSRTSASPSPSRSTEPTTTPSTPAASASQEESAAAREPTPPTLRRGDRGPEVTELELRLTQLGLYTREARGNYNEGVEDAVTRYQWARGVEPEEEYGVYDLATREMLESETTA